jgi:hypothetical protein
MEVQTAKGVDVAALVNISTEKWPPRQRTRISGRWRSLRRRPAKRSPSRRFHGCLGTPKAKKLWKSQRILLTLRRISYIMLTTRSATRNLPQPVSRKGFDKGSGGLFPAAVLFPAADRTRGWNLELADLRR